MLRFMIHLQASNRRSTGMESLNDSHVDSIIFQRVVGSLGSALVVPEHVDEASDGSREPSGYC